MVISIFAVTYSYINPSPPGVKNMSNSRAESSVRVKNLNEFIRKKPDSDVKHDEINFYIQ